MNISFKGYENIFAGQIHAYDNSKSMTVLSAKLNDVGSPDLTELRKLKDMARPESMYDDIDVVTFVHSYTNGEHEIFVNDQMFLTPNELKQTGIECVPEHLSEADFKKMEKFHLKAYTIVAGLTKRMIGDSNARTVDKSQEAMPRTLAQLNNIAKQIVNGETVTIVNKSLETLTGALLHLYNLTGNMNSAFDVLSKFLLTKNDNYQKIAGDVNKFIVRSIKNYF